MSGPVRDVLGPVRERLADDLRDRVGQQAKEVELEKSKKKNWSYRNSNIRAHPL